MPMSHNPLKADHHHVKASIKFLIKVRESKIHRAGILRSSPSPVRAAPLPSVVMPRNSLGSCTNMVKSSGKEVL